jgi:DNA polymerase-4
LLSEKVTSRTVMLKIRYDDFSTFSVQETTEDYITSVDDIFARAKKLFDKKYEFPKGIRLLGISVENIIDQNQSRQQVLFDFGEKKKQAVENAILNIKTKHPELKIKKARLLDTNNIIKAFIPLILVTSLFTSKIHAEETFTTIDSSTAGTVPTVKEFDKISSDTNEYLYNYNIKNNNLKLFMEGWWQAALEGTINSTYSSKNGFSIYSSLPIFKQEIDLSLLLKLNDSWYFNTEFADEFNKNTISLGYENDFSHFKISNRGIAFPNYYSAEELGLNIGGGQNQAPGIGIHIEDNIQNKWKADFALRYNFTKQKEATFYGKNSVVEKEIKLNEFITGKTFTLPHSLIGNIKEIYVENSKGNYTDEFGVKYNKLSSSEYLILPENNQIIFSSTAQTLKTNDKIPHILIEFSSGININSEIGTYQNKDSYLGKIQEYFGSKSTFKPDLEKYSYDFNITMNNKSMLKIQSPAGFSPFMVANEYDLGEKTEYDVTLTNKYSSTQNNEYKVALKTNEINFVTQDFLTEHHAYAEVYSENSNFNFPLADKYPEFYLNLFPNVDLILSVKKYTPISRFDIGTDIAENSVKVYKNGILDSSAKYDKDSGTVILSSQVNSFDKIYITWQEDTSDSKNGSISGAAGFFYNLCRFL